MKKKGFTLIELLAVIIILGIVITLATPSVMNIMKKSEEKAFKANVQGYIKAIDTDHFDKNDFISSFIIEDGKLINNGYEEDLNIKTTINDVKGFIFVDERNKKYGSIYNDKMCAEYYNNKVTYKEKCTYETYENGKEIYFNPEKNELCSISDVNTELDAKSGCLKWHIFNDKEENSYVDMILDHDTTISIPFNSEVSIKMNEVKTQLEEDTDNWYTYLGARLITAKEITEITKYDYQLLNGHYYLGTNSKEIVTYSPGTNPYKWLFNNTGGCLSYGCDVEREGENGYWTSEYIDDIAPLIWHIRGDGSLNSNNASTSLKGVRPVIRLNKTQLY